MTQKYRQIFIWAYAAITVLTFLGLAALVGFEAYTRWFTNQNYSVLGNNDLASIAVLFAVQTIGFVWLYKIS